MDDPGARTDDAIGVGATGVGSGVGQRTGGRNRAVAARAMTPAAPTGSPCVNCYLKRKLCDRGKPVCGRCSRAKVQLAPCSYEDAGLLVSAAQFAQAPKAVACLACDYGPDSSKRSKQRENPF